MNGWFCRKYPYRLEVRVQSGLRRTAAWSPVSCEMDLGRVLAEAGRRREEFDPAASSSSATTAAESRRSMIRRRKATLRYVVPHRFDSAYGSYALPCFNPIPGKGTLTWLLRDNSVRAFAVYFDHKRPRRPPAAGPAASAADRRRGEVRIGVPGPMVFSIRPTLRSLRTSTAMAARRC